MKLKVDFLMHRENTIYLCRGFPTAWNYVTLLFSGLQIKRDIGYERSWKCDSFYGDGWALTAFLTSPKGNEQRKQEM
jgi:hypothetical protein